LFVSLFLSDPPKDENISTITRAQALISTVTVLIVFLLCRSIIPIPFALAATTLTAISPHLVTANIYILSETLFCFMLVLVVYAMGKITSNKSLAAPAVAGIVLAAASLTHPLLLYFFIPVTIFLAGYWGWKKGYKKALLLVIGFSLLFGAWVTRNVISVDAPSDNHLMLMTLRAGAYRNLMYQDDPRTYPYPNHADPDFKKTSRNLPSVLSEIVREFEASPMKQLRWYLVEKPIIAWSWDMIEGYHFGEKGDVFTFPVISTPYHYLIHFRLTHAFMHATHWALVILMVGGVILVWLPQKKLGLSDESVFVARVISLLLLYHIAIMILGSPTSRHSIPMRPFMYIMSMLPIVLAFNWYLNWRVTQPAQISLNRRRTKHPSKRRQGSNSRRAPTQRGA